MNLRRQFLKLSIASLATLGLFLNPLFLLIRSAVAKGRKIILPRETDLKTLISKNPADLDAGNLPVTPLKDFQTMGLSDHKVDPDTWRLSVQGHVKKPIDINYDQLLALPSIEREVLLICPGFFAMYGQWKGVSIVELLKAAQADESTTHVTIRGPKGDYERVERYPIEDIRTDKVFLAYQVNDQSLPEKHGFPLRLVAEGHYGSEWIKYVYGVSADIIKGSSDD